MKKVDEEKIIKEQRRKRGFFWDRIETFRDIVVIAGAAILGAIASTMLDIYYLMPDLGTKILAGILIFLIVLTYAFVFTFPVYEITQKAKGEK
jgi:hypothetical protein